MAFEPITLAGRRFFGRKSVQAIQAPAVLLLLWHAVRVLVQIELLQREPLCKSRRRRREQEAPPAIPSSRGTGGTDGRRFGACSSALVLAICLHCCSFGGMSVRLNANTKRGIIGRQQSGEHLRNCPAQ